MHPCGLAEFPGLATTLPPSGNDSETPCIADGLLVSLLFLFLRNRPCLLAEHFRLPRTPLALHKIRNSKKGMGKRLVNGQMCSENLRKFLSERMLCQHDVKGKI